MERYPELSNELNREGVVPLRMGWTLRALNILSGLFLTGWGIRGVAEFVSGLL